jgi:hypothetical protein
MNTNKSNSQYEVLSPWADVDPVQLKGIAPRVENLAGKKIGLYAISKAAARPILTIVEAKLKERFPACTTSWYDSYQSFTVLQVESENKEKFEKWVRGLDAVVTAVGD